MSYALITGASKGIGKCIAEELARRKINLLLVARSENLLKEVAQELTEKYKIKADYLAIDLAQPDAPSKIADWINKGNYPLNILVNNAGYGLSGAFESYSMKEHTDMVHVNAIAPLQLTYLLLPRLRTQAQSYIMNIASTAAYQAVPGLGVYAASKSFVLSLGRALKYELRKTNVSVTTISPGSADTDFPNRAKVGSKALKLAKKVNLTPEGVAKVSVRAMFSKKTEVVIGIINKLNVFATWLFPKSLIEKSAAGIYEIE